MEEVSRCLASKVPDWRYAFDRPPPFLQHSRIRSRPIGPQNVKDGILEFYPYKGRDNYQKTLKLLVLPLAQVIISESVTGSRTFMVADFGKPFLIKGMGSASSSAALRLGSIIVRRMDCGIRATLSAENGATEEQIRAIYGWENAKKMNLHACKACQRFIAANATQLLDFGEAISNFINRDQALGAGEPNKWKR